MPDFPRLKAKHREVRQQEGFSGDLNLRVHRALSWLDRAERERNDDDDAAVFIFLWIGFNAAYASEISEDMATNERSVFGDYFGKLLKLDNQSRIYDAIWDEFPQSIRVFIDNPYVFQPFWRHHNQAGNHGDWERQFRREKKYLNDALEKQRTDNILNGLFGRLYVLRNQLIHGGTTWGGRVNREQLRDGRNILGKLLPIFIELMMDNPGEDWGKPYYPVVEV